MASLTVCGCTSDDNVSETLLGGIGYWQAANVWSALANQDHITNATQYQSVVTNALETAFDLYSDYDQFQ